MTSSELRKKFLDFFKKQGHKIIPSSSLIPEDKTVLLTSAGMQQFVSYLSGEKDVLRGFNFRYLCSIQKCFRTPDIDEVGDDSHHTFFEMLGNWSIGEDSKNGYFKEGAIKLALDFFINRIGLDKNRFWITIFKGENNIPRDEEAFKIWQKYGIPAKRIVEFGLEDNFWGPTAKIGPCGPSSEIHYDRGEKYGCGDSNCGPNCPKCNRFLELWNLVFMEYEKNEDGSYGKLPQRNVDTGIGLERLLALLEKKDSAYETDLFKSIIEEIERISGEKYEKNKKNFRIIADHVRGAVFLIADGVLPSNIERGYILRRILRRAIRYGKILNPIRDSEDREKLKKERISNGVKMPKNFLISLAKKVIEIYQNVYPEIKSNQTNILTAIQNEEEKFEKTLENGLKQLNRLLKKNKDMNGGDAFYLYESFGFPLELTEEIAKEKGIKVDKKEFQKALKKHQEISRAGVEKKFGGLGKGADYEGAKLHTATHLLHAALREVLGEHVKQMGSDITSQRLRFDFFHPAKMTEDEIKKVEEIVNQKIKENLEIKKEEMPYEKAVKSGALAFFKEKYPGTVSVYSINNFSKEICVGPHAKRTSELGKFKIIKEESSGASVRRIRAVLE